jgi:DNA-binding CsgD family transcriptional regulator
VTVEHQEPASLRLLRRIGDLPLSPVQMEVCLMLARRQSQESIARQLNIRLATVKDHVRKIYLKLGVHQRDELAERLLAVRGDCT